MKRIVQLAVVALACSAGAAWSQQEQQMPQAAQNADTSISVAQASPVGERISIQRDEPAAKPRKPSLHDMSSLAADGAFPSRGGPLDD